MDGDRRLPTSTEALALAVAALGAAAAAASLILMERLPLAGGPVVAGGVAVAIAARFAEDAGLGRVTFVVEGIERVLDAAVLGSLAWVSLGEAPRTAAAALTVLGTGAVVAYLRARGRGLGYRVPLWPGYRAGRSALIGAGLLASAPEAGLWAALAVDVVIGGARWAVVARQGEPR